MPARIENALVLGLSGDDVALFILVKVHDSFDGDIIRFRCAGSENYLFRRSADKIGDLRAGGFDGDFGFPAEEVGPGVGVTVTRKTEREHGIEDTWVDWSGCLHIEVERAARDSHAFQGDSVLVLLRFIRRRNRGGCGGGKGADAGGLGGLS